jgi:excisionase family DNA binding protein
MATKTKVDPEDLIDVSGGARMIFVTKKTIANWLSAGKLTRYKVNGGRVLISKRELLGLIRKEA